MSWFDWLKRSLARPNRVSDGVPLPVQRTARSEPHDDSGRHGVALLKAGDFESARLAFEAAIALAPGVASHHVSLAFAFQEMSRHEDALVHLQRAVAIDPASFDAHFMLGLAFEQANDPDSALPHFTNARALDRSSVEAATRMALVCKVLHRHTEACNAVAQALALRPDDADICNVAGLVFQSAGRTDDAIAAFEKAIAARPGDAGLHANLGLAMQEDGRLRTAVKAYREAIVLAPTVEMHNHLGVALARLGATTEALAEFRTALAMTPAHVNVQANLASAYADAGLHAEAIDTYRDALRAEPEHRGAISGLLYNLSVSDHFEPGQYLREARRFAAKVAGAQAGEWQLRHRGNDDTLRVGFVSGDLQDHPVAYFIEGVMQHLNHTTLEAFAYSTVSRSDSVTERLRPLFAGWRIVKGLTDIEAAALIRGDRIDILIDLGGHTAGGRLDIFALRAAAIQVAWLGYFASTGLATMDHVLADALCVPPGQEFMFSEHVWRLPETRLCFTPPVDAAQYPVNAPPAATAGCITFASFQRWSKITKGVIALWARVLAAVPTSRLLLQSAQSGQRSQVEAMLQRCRDAGIDTSRITIGSPAPRDAYLRSYDSVDIVLDTFPYTGGTTTCEALWMGVPTLTLNGASMIARQGVAMLTLAGLPDWVAADHDEYVSLAIQKATDVEALAQLRVRLRKRVEASPLFDTARFARHFIDAMFGIWQYELARRDRVIGPSPR